MTPIVHLAPGTSAPSHQFATLNGLTAALIPPIKTVRPCFFLPPLGLLTVTFLGPLCLPTSTVPKRNVVGLILA